MPRSFPGTRTYRRSTSLSGPASPRATDPKTASSAMPYFRHNSARREPSALISSRVTASPPSADLKESLRRRQPDARDLQDTAVSDSLVSNPPGRAADAGLRSTGLVPVLFHEFLPTASHATNADYPAPAQAARDQFPTC